MGEALEKWVDKAATAQVLVLIVLAAKRPLVYVFI